MQKTANAGGLTQFTSYTTAYQPLQYHHNSTKEQVIEKIFLNYSKNKKKGKLDFRN